MSRKLVVLIQDIKGLPGKYKRVLQAWASFANNDGSNIFASKESVADRAGISRWTVYENTDDLIATGVMQRTSSHTCKTEKCDKGGTHFTSQHGQYTVVYRINVALLENPTVLIQKLSDPTVVKPRKGTVGKSRKGTVVKPDATQAVNPTPATAGQNETLPQVPCEESKQANEPVPSPSAQADEITLTDREFILLEAVEPVWQSTKLDLYKSCLKATLEQLDCCGVDECDLLRYNRYHKKGGLVIRTVEQYFNAVATSTALVNEYLTHEPCDKCRRCPARPDGVVGKKGMDEHREYEAEQAEKRRQLAELRTWYESQHGLWDFTLVTTKPENQTMAQFAAIIESGKNGMPWLPAGVKLSEKLSDFDGSKHDDTPHMWSAAINRVVRDGQFMTYEQFSRYRKDAEGYELCKAKLAAKMAENNMAFEAEEV